MDTVDSLLKTIGSSTPEEFEAILKQRPDLVRTPIGEYNELPIHFAAWQDRDAIINVLLDADADIDAHGDRGQTALHYASRFGCPAAASVLIARGANLNALDDDSFSAAFLGVRGRENESVEIARMIVDAGAEVDLNLAVCLHEMERVEKLLAGDPHAIQNSRFPNDLVLDAVIAVESAVFDQLALDDYDDATKHTVAIQANDGILRRLLSRGAPIDAPDFGWSPLFQSCQMKTPNITELLLEHGANPNVRYHNDDLSSVLMCSTCPEEMLLVLNRHGFKPKEA